MLSCSIDLTLINVFLKSFLGLIAGSLLIIFLFYSCIGFIDGVSKKFHIQKV